MKRLATILQIAYVIGYVLTLGPCYVDTRNRLYSDNKNDPAGAMALGVSGAAMTCILWPAYWTAVLAESKPPAHGN